jgi:RNA polymerase sigma factor (sigma-70 family)
MARDREAVARELLAVRCRRGDPAALEELVRAFEGRLLYFVRRIVPNEADGLDVLQKTWMRVLKGIGSLDDPRQLVPWLYRVARNTALSHARVRVPPHEPLTDHPAPADDGAGFEDAEAVHRGLAGLTLPHREVLTLFFLEGMSVEDAAAVLGVPPGTVKSRLHYAKVALRKALDGVPRRE